MQNKSKRGVKREGGKKILIGWSPALREVVARLKAKKMPKSKQNMMSVFLIRNRSGNRYTASELNAIWMDAMDEAMRLGVIEERFHFHNIRAMGATELDDTGRNPQQLLGHASRTTTEKYIRSRKTVKEAPAK